MPSAIGVSLALFLVAAAPPTAVTSAASGAHTIAVLPVDDPGSAVSPELAEAAHALRLTLREQAATVLTPAEVRSRIGAVDPGLAELERAYAGAHAAYQADELDSAARILGSVLSDLEQLPESTGAHELLVRAQLRLAQVERARSRPAEAAAWMERILALDPGFVVDADQFPPSFRRAFDEVRARVQLARKARLEIRARGPAVLVFVDGRAFGPAPVEIELPPGQHRVRGALLGATGAASLTPAVLVTLAEQPIAIELDAALAESVRLAPAPSIAAGATTRGAVVTRVGEWLRADQVVALERSDREGPGISATLYDVRRGALVREAQAPVVGGTVPPESVRALASYLRTGARSAPRIDLAAADPAKSPPARWLRPAAYAGGVAALALGAVAVLEARASHDSAATAAAMVRPDGALVPGSDRGRYDDAVHAADGSMRNAYVAGGGAIAVALTAALLGYRSLDVRSGPVLVPAVRF